MREVQSKKKKLINLLLASDQSKERKATENEAQVCDVLDAQRLSKIANADSQELRKFLS